MLTFINNFVSVYHSLYSLISVQASTQTSSNYLSPGPASLPERYVFDVILGKDSDTGFGITIVGSESMDKLDLGVFIKSVAMGGPAAIDGRIRPGDRLLAINDNSLEGLQHHRAVQMIRESGSQVKLLISQVKCPTSLRRKDYDDSLTLTKLRGSNVNPEDVQIYRQLSQQTDDTSETGMIHVDNISHVQTVNNATHYNHDYMSAVPVKKDENQKKNKNLKTKESKDENIPRKGNSGQHSRPVVPPINLEDWQDMLHAADVNAVTQVDTVVNNVVTNKVPVNNVINGKYKFH